MHVQSTAFATLPFLLLQSCLTRASCEWRSIAVVTEHLSLLLLLLNNLCTSSSTRPGASQSPVCEQWLREAQQEALQQSSNSMRAGTRGQQAQGTCARNNSSNNASRSHLINVL